MNSYQRPCLKCRRLFTPDNNSRSYCAEHKPIIKPKRKYNYPKGKRAYDDAEYRRNRKIIRKQQTQTAGAGVLISYGDHEVYVSEPVRSAGMENLDSRQYF